MANTHNVCLWCLRSLTLHTTHWASMWADDSGATVCAARQAQDTTTATKTAAPRHVLRRACTIARRLSRWGFKLEGTGGNCTAYIRRNENANDAIEELITIDGDASAPRRLADPCVVGVYTDERSEPDGEERATLGEILTALERNDDEYTLLFLKLHNGHHKHA